MCAVVLFRELQAESQRSPSVQEKSRRLTQIKEKLERESVCRKNRSYLSLQEMLTVHQVEYKLNNYEIFYHKPSLI